MPGRVLGLSIGYHVKGGAADPLALHKMSTAFERTGEQLREFGPLVFPRVITVLEGETKRQFRASGQGPNRGTWAPLTPRYALQKRRDGYGSKTLVRTGAMRAGLTEQNSGHALRAFNATSMSFGTTGVNYASFHQAGTSRMTDRPPFDFGEETEKKMRAAASAAAREAYGKTDLAKYATVTNKGLDAGWDSAFGADE